MAILTGKDCKNASVKTVNWLICFLTMVKISVKFTTFKKVLV